MGTIDPIAVVKETLLACLPDGVPPSFRTVDSAALAGHGRGQTITATLTMFDGLPATVRLSRWSLGWSHQFTEMPGGAASFAEGQWRRLP
jgi:hypothetical protein